MCVRVFFCFLHEILKEHSCRKGGGVPRELMKLFFDGRMFCKNAVEIKYLLFVERFHF